MARGLQHGFLWLLTTLLSVASSNYKLESSVYTDSGESFYIGSTETLSAVIRLKPDDLLFWSALGWNDL